MQIVIQCAGSKHAVGWLRTLKGTRVLLVADPSRAPSGDDIDYAHPDAPSDRPGKTWREVVVASNAVEKTQSWCLP